MDVYECRPNEPPSGGARVGGRDDGRVHRHADSGGVAEDGCDIDPQRRITSWVINC